MHRASSESLAAERKRWLAELTEAIDEAQQLAWRISSDGSRPEAMDLYVRLELARVEVESLRRSGWAELRQDLPSDWIELLPESLKPPRSFS